MSRVSFYVFFSQYIYIDDEEDDDVKNDLKIVENIRIQFEIFSCLRRLTTCAPSSRENFWIVYNENFE